MSTEENKPICILITENQRNKNIENGLTKRKKEEARKALLFCGQFSKLISFFKHSGIAERDKEEKVATQCVFFRFLFVKYANFYF